VRKPKYLPDRTPVRFAQVQSCADRFALIRRGAKPFQRGLEGSFDTSKEALR
jgi:Cdc6-like AAA superfamily ATPase